MKINFDRNTRVVFVEKENLLSVVLTSLAVLVLNLRNESLN